MKTRSDPEISKAAAAAGIRAVPRPLEPAAANQGSHARDSTPAREGAAPRDSAIARDSTLERETTFERSISTTRPASLASIDLSLNVVSHGKLTWRTVLAWLRDDKVLSADDVERTARRFAGGNSAQHPLVRIGSAGLTRVGDGKVLDTETLTEWLAKRTKLPYLRIDPLKVDVGRVADVMSIQYAERRHALPLTFGVTEVMIATCEPLDIAWVPEIEAHTRRHVKLVIVNPIEIARYTTEFYALSRSVRNATKMGESAALANFEQLVELGKSNKQLDANDSGVIQVVDWLWQYAFDQRASDIHLEPRRERSVIRFRIDGVMHTVYQLPPGVMSAMVARVKLLGRMDVIERRRPLDGRIKVRNPAGDEVEMRLSTLPTAFGEKMVMRIFDPDTTVKTLESLGFGNHDGRRWEELVARPHGIILVTGPTGSGKTTTLYSTLRRLATDEVNVCTIEDPIEMIQPAFNQTQVQTGIDLGFTEGLRALMRQDPDIIMVGEIRDLATADMAIQASLTGHLVFSTLHTNDSASAITRLNDLGVAPYLIGSTLIGVLAQRLVRTLCPACKVPDAEVTRETLHEVVKPWRLNGGVRPVQGGRLPRVPDDRLSRPRRPVRAADRERRRAQHHPAGLRRRQAAPAGAAGRPSAFAPGRRDEGRRGRDHARRSPARDAGLGIAARAPSGARCKPDMARRGRCLESPLHGRAARLREDQERARLLVGPDVRRRRRRLRDRRHQLQHGPGVPAQRSVRGQPLGAPVAAVGASGRRLLPARPEPSCSPLLGAVVLFKSLTIESEGGDQDRRVRVAAAAHHRRRHRRLRRSCSSRSGSR